MIKRKVRDIVRVMFRKWKTLLGVITFDVLFILALLSLRFVQVSLDNVLFPLFANMEIISLVYSFFYVILEFFLIILLYSFFKYFIVEFMLEGFRKAEFKLKRFLYFLKLNLTMFIPLIVILVIVLDLIITFSNNWLSKGGIDPFMFVSVVFAIGILALISFVFVYTFMNIVHFAFLKEQSLKKLLKKGIIKSFRVDSYKMYWNNLKIILVSGVLLLIIHFVVKTFIFDDFSSYIKNLGSYKLFIYWAITLVLYFLLLFNRFNFCRDLSSVNE